MSADVHALSGAYVVDAVTADERAQFEVHLSRCPTCRLEVESLREAAGRLSLTVALAPAREVRPAVAAAGSPQGGSGTLPRRPSRHRTRWLHPLAAVAAVLAIGVMTSSTSQMADAPPSRGADAPFESADARLHTIAVESGTFQIATSEALGLMAVRAPASELPADRTYQLWVVTDRARSLGVLGDAGSRVRIPSAGRVAVTVEPAGGSPQPTTVPLFGVDVTKL